jgi:Transposase DDE domain group 1
VQATNTRPRFEVTADAHGICSHAGVVLLAELADRLGLTQELGRRANLGLVRRGGGLAHDRGAVLRDLVVLLADGGDCLSDLASLRDQAGLFGRVCSTPTAWRVVGQVAADPRGVAALWSGMARVRQRAWALGAAPQGPLRLDLDATCWRPTPISRARPARSSTASGSTRWCAGWTAGTAPGRH